ncbi:MAG TPA: FG-GAP-like repeat-containing protein [Desulfobacteria bacterium]|nr:FG-GAP-like repeat-containing protein [Desulfobacteria bacterium]
MKSDKKMAILITAVLAASVCAMIPATQAILLPPEPDLGWVNTSSDGDVTDVAIGDLTLNGIDNVAFIDYLPSGTVFALHGNNGTEYWNYTNVSGFSIAVGDVDGDGKNEVVAGGYNDNESKPGITVFEDNGTVKFFYETNSSLIKDIELGDLDGDLIDDIVACNNEEGDIYAFNGTGTNGSDLTGWPKHFSGENFMDLALGNLDGVGELDIAALSYHVTTLYAFNSTGNELWPPNTTVSGRSVEIGDVDGDMEAEVVIGDYGSNSVFVYDGDTGTLEYSFPTGSDVAEIELGDLDDDPTDLEIAALTEPPKTLYALKVESGNPNLVELWNYSINWYSQYWGEGLAIGDVDRDYKNEVIAASTSAFCRIWAFDGLDSNGDGEGDVVWMYELGPGPVPNDIEVGDIDGDGDMDVIVGTSGGNSVYALFTQEHTTEVGSETIFFDSDPSNITDVASVPMPSDPQRVTTSRMACFPLT